MITDASQKLADREKLARWSSEAEQALISAALHSLDVAQKATEKVQPHDFSNLFDEELWRRVTQAALRGKVLTIAELKPWAIEQGYFDYLYDIYSNPISLYDWENYANLVREGGARRLAYTLSEMIRESAVSANGVASADDLMEKVERMTLDITGAPRFENGGGLAHIKDSGEEYLHKLRNPDKSGINTGIASLDKIIGGLRAGHMCCIGARPGMGKSALMLSILRHNLESPKFRAAVFSYEMNSAEILERWVAAELDISIDRQRSGYLSQHEYEDIERLVHGLSEKHCFLNVSTDVTVEKLIAQVRRVHSIKPLSMIIIDHLGLIAPSMGENENLRTAHKTRMLKVLATQLKIPVIILHQLNRELERRQDKSPVLSDLRDSGSVEQDCDQVVFLFRPAYYTWKDPPMRHDFLNQEAYARAEQEWLDGQQNTEIIVAKNRHGRIGVAPAKFLGPRFHFTDI